MTGEGNYCLRGVLRSCSHVIHSTQQSPYFILEGLTSSSTTALGKRWVVVANDKHLSRRLVPEVGTILKIRYLDRGIFKISRSQGRPDLKITAFKSTAKTQVKPISQREETPVINDGVNDQKSVIHCQAVVTNDDMGDDGIYTLQKKVTLLSLHSQLQVPRLYKGRLFFCILVFNAAKLLIVNLLCFCFCLDL